MVSDRYMRHQMISWFDQDRIKTARIGVLGAGAVGNEVIKNLVLLGVGEIDIYDFDTIESHNLTRSVLFRPSDVGAKKANVASERARELDPDVTITGYHGDYWEMMPMKRFLEYDCLISCLDSFSARIKLNRLCHITGKPLVNTGIDSQYASIQWFPFFSQSACFECGLGDAAYATAQDRNSCGSLGPKAEEARLIPTTIITASIAGSLAASKALSLISRRESRNSEDISTTTIVDTIGGQTTNATFRRKIECGGCTFPDRNIDTFRTTGDLKADIASIQKSCSQSIKRIYFSDPVFMGFEGIKHDGVVERKNSWQLAESVPAEFEEYLVETMTDLKIDVRDSIDFEHLLSLDGKISLPSKYAVCVLDEKQYLIY